MSFAEDLVVIFHTRLRSDLSPQSRHEKLEFKKVFRHVKHGSASPNNDERLVTFSLGMDLSSKKENRDRVSAFFKP